jgi:two-component system sensor histidine kinase DctS
VNPVGRLLRQRIRRFNLLWRSWGLWGWLMALVVLVLATLVWMTGRYETGQVQNKLEADTAEAVADIRNALRLNVQNMVALQVGKPSTEEWRKNAEALLHQRREMLRIEWLTPQLTLRTFVDTPYRPSIFEFLGRTNSSTDVALACAAALRFQGPAYSRSYYLPQLDGLGVEVIEMCQPVMVERRLESYVIATYSLPGILADVVGQQLSRSQEVSFVEADGTRLALHGLARRGTRMFTAQQLLDLPGNPLLLRMDSWHGAPDVFPNVMTALVTLMSIALVSVTVLLVRDTRRRLQAERGLADALAFRKAMEDSLVTGLRARDLDGHITYVNPAFCDMVGLAPEDLLGRRGPLPYWPPELVEEYTTRQGQRVIGTAPPREGFESVFLRKDGTRFPVLVIEAPLINERGFQTGWMSAVLDISEQRRVEELSRASEERLQVTARLATVGEMASLLSHELNQPLAAISSYATGSLNLMRLRGGEEGGARLNMADMEQALLRISEQAERAGRVIRSVQRFVRRANDARQAVDPIELFVAILPLVQLQARQSGVRLVLQVPEGLPPVLCDRTMVEQVLLNLARNAMQAMDGPLESGVSERTLTMRVEPAPAAAAALPDGTRPRSWLLFSVADVGAGIDPLVAERVFTPFFSTRPDGMGLGLSMCRTVIEQHGGFLEFGPNLPHGTVFRFTLPTDLTAPPTTPATIAALTV